MALSIVPIITIMVLNKNETLFVVSQLLQIVLHAVHDRSWVRGPLYLLDRTNWLHRVPVQIKGVLVLLPILHNSDLGCVHC